MAMNRNLIGALLILIVGLIGIGAYKLFSASLLDKTQMQASDAKVNLTIRMAGDSYRYKGCLG